MVLRDFVKMRDQNQFRLAQDETFNTPLTERIENIEQALQAVLEALRDASDIR
jgi:hypothetical protein